MGGVYYNRGQSGVSYGNIFAAGAYLTADGGENGTGTNNYAGLQAAATAFLADTNKEYFLIPAGKYAIGDFTGDAGLTMAVASGRRRVVIDGFGADLIFNHDYDVSEGASWQNRKCLAVRCLTFDAIEAQIEGVRVRMVRKSHRVSGCSAIFTDGFKRVIIRHCSIPVAENHGIHIADGGDTSDATGFLPEYWDISHNEIGSANHLPTVNDAGVVTGGLLHDYGPVGDTGIWGLSPPEQALITNNVIWGTGDDGIFVGHNSRDLAGTATRRQILIAHNSLNNTSGGIGAYVPNCEIAFNQIDNCLNNAIRVNADELNTNGVGGHRTRIIGNTITRQGHRAVADANCTTDIGAVEQRAIRVRSFDIEIKDNKIENSKAAGVILMYPSSSVGLTSYSRIIIEGNTFTKIGCNKAGDTLDAESSGKPAIERNTSGSGGTISDVIIRNNFHGQSNQPFMVINVGGTTAANVDDRWTVENNILHDITLSSTYAAIYVAGSNSSRITNLRAGSYSAPGFVYSGSTSIARLYRVSGGATQPWDVEVYARNQAGYTFGFGLNTLRGTNSGNAGVPGGRKGGIKVKRTPTASGEIAAYFDLSKSYFVRAWVEGASASAGAQGLTMVAKLDCTTQRATILQHYKASAAAGSDAITVTDTDSVTAGNYYFTLNRDFTASNATFTPPVAAGSFVSGKQYYITFGGTTDWNAIGATTVAATATVNTTAYVITALGNTDFNAIGATTVAATAMVANTEYVITSVGTSTFTSVGASANTVGTIFTATTSTTGTGTVVPRLFTATGAGSGTGTVSPRSFTATGVGSGTGLAWPGCWLLKLNSVSAWAGTQVTYVEAEEDLGVGTSLSTQGTT